MLRRLLVPVILIASASSVGAQAVADSSSPTPRAIVIRSSNEAAGAFVGALLASEDVGPAAVSEQCLASLPDEWLVGQVLMTAVTEAEIARALPLIADGSLGGVMVKGSPSAAIAGLNAAIHETSLARYSVPAMIAVDEEGGRVQRLARLLGRIPTAAAVASSMTPAEAQQLMFEHGELMFELGFTVDFAPVIDVGGGPPIGNRSYGDDVETVDLYGAAAAAGLSDAGLLAVYKHFPGHGSADADSHLSLPTTAPIEQMRELHLLPFVAAVNRGDGAIMVGHLLVPGLTEELPTSLSPAVVQGLLRDEMGFDGLVFTDSLEMGAIVRTRSLEDAAVLALIAGNDVALLGNLGDVAPSHERVMAALSTGELSRERVLEAVGRILVEKDVHPCTLNVP